MKNLNSAQPSALIETHELAERLANDPGLRLVDATFHIPPSPRDALTEFQAQHLPGAVFFDIDRIADTSAALPHMLPSAEQFARQIGELGIQASDFIVVYDVHGLLSAPRAWWMFRCFGHTNVTILNGGLPKWLKEGRPIESGLPSPKSVNYQAHWKPELVTSWQQIQNNLETRTAQVLDMRSAGRFHAREPEPREGLRSGHIPSSINLPWASFVDPETYTLRDNESLRELFQTAGVQTDGSTICSCGSGVTACMAALSLYQLGNPSATVYDGAWAEWGSRHDLPIELD